MVCSQHKRDCVYILEVHAALLSLSQILQCVAMNLTLLYALLAYSSIKQKDFSGVYVSCPSNISLFYDTM